MRRWLGPMTWCLGAFGLLAAGPLQAQQPGDSVRAELNRLQMRVDSLESLVRRLQPGAAQAAPAEPADPLAALRAAAQAAAAGGGGADTTATVAPTQTQFTGRQRSLQALNPEISANADFLGHLNTDDVHEQNFVPREFEFSFQSALDPYSRAKIFASYHSPGPELVPFGAAEAEDAGLDVEEGYVEWVGLPGGLGLKLGRFQQSFGTLNRWHSHALSFQSRSLPHIAFIGQESLGQTGASMTWLVPIHGLGAYELTGEVTRSSNETLFGQSARANVLGNLNAFYELSRSTDLNLTASWVNGSYEDDTNYFDRNLFGLEWALTWRPPQTGNRHGLVVRGGLMVLDGLLLQDTSQPAGSGRALGVWNQADLRLAERWYVGGRYDWTENPQNTDETSWLVSPTITWWESEFVRLRAEYDLLGRSTASNEGRLWVQVTFAMGPHKHETY